MEKEKLEELQGIIGSLRESYIVLDAEVNKWLSSFASCAIEGNTLGRHMCDLWNDEKFEQFLEELNDWIEKKIDWDGEKWVKVGEDIKKT